MKTGGLAVQVQWDKLSQKLKSFNNSIHKPDFKGAVTTAMPRTFLLGNGDLAAVSDGSATAKRYLFGKNDFWSCGDLQTNAVMDFDVRRVTTLRAGALSFDNLTCRRHFCEQIDLTCASVKSVYDDVSITAYCLADCNAMVFTVLSKTNRALNMTLSVPNNAQEYPCAYVEDQSNGYIQRSTADFAKNEKSWTSTVALRLFDAEDELQEVSHTNSEIRYHIELAANKSKHLVLAAGGGGKTYDGRGRLLGSSAVRQAADLLERLSDAQKIMSALQKHADWWRAFWCASFVDLSDFDLEKYYYGSLYIMACCSRENKMPPGLYGNFITTDHPKWNGDFHMNYNFIAPFYGMYASNRPEFAKPLAEPLLDFIPEGRRRAKEETKLVCREYVCGGMCNGQVFASRRDLRRGIDNAVLYHVALGPYGVSAWDEHGGYWHQIDDAAFTAMGLTAYYFYTLDGEFLRKIAEFLELNVNFFLAWREKEMLPDGGYRYNLWSGAHEGSFELNATHVVGTIKNILHCLLDGVNRGFLQVSREKADVWQDFSDHLPQYPIRNAKHGRFFKKKKMDNILALGEKGLVYNEYSATVALEFIHPCEDMTFDSDDRVKEASRRTIDWYKALDHDSFRQVNNLPKIFIHAIRCGYSPEKVLSEFKRLYRKDFMVNYSVKDYGDTHGIEKSGGIEFIHSMLLSSDTKTIKVFPNWLKDRDGSFVNLRARGAFLVSASYSAKDQRVQHIEITSLVQDKIQIYNEFSHPDICSEDGQPVPYTEFADRHGRAVLCFDAVPNQTYRISESSNEYKSNNEL